MAIVQSIEPITASDEELRAALEEAQLASLLPALAQVLGDVSILEPQLAPDTSVAMRAVGGYTPEKAAQVREVALQALKRFRDGGSKVVRELSDAELHRALEFLAGGELTEEYVPLLLEELAYPVKDARAPKWTKEQLAPGRAFSAIVIGAGMSGILAGYRLKQAGIPFTIIEKNADVGGTWWENTYPGARVDNANAMYSYSFAQRTDWPYYYSPQKVLHGYFSDCADEFGVRQHVRFNTEVLDAAWDDAKGLWKVHVREQGGREETLEANALIASTGQLNRPNFPEIAGRDSFEGPSFHSAQWDHSIDLKEKRVAVIGNGASASQLIPEVAKEAAEMLVFQRTPTWYAPVPNYHDEVPPKQQWLFRHVPRYAQWYRFWIFWTSAEGLLPSARVEEGWDGDPASIGARNDEVRAMFTMYMQGQLADRPDLIEKVIPKYPPASKRIVLDNGIWPQTLKRDNVRLITEPIAEITPRGVRTADGEEYRADVIIYATGFQASRFLTPMTVRGRDSVDLNEQWDGDARAYMGVVVPNFPNFFMTYGPNTNIVVNGSIVYFSECEITYVMGCMRMLLETGAKAFDCKVDVHDRYNDWIDRGNLQMAWGVAEVPSWYRNANGRSTQNWPYSLLEFWQQTREPRREDFVLA